MKKLLAALFCALVLAGCAQMQKEPFSMERVTERMWRLEYDGERPVVDFSNVSVVFAEDGKLYGSAGCNRFFGEWKDDRERETLVVRIVGATRMICPPALMEQEGRFLRHLEKAQSIDLDETGALLIYAQGQDKPMLFREAVQAREVGGIISWEGQEPLPSGSVLTVRLEDVSRMDVPAVVLGEVVIENPGAGPVSFRVSYDRGRIRPEHSYAVHAEIRRDGQLLYVTDTLYPVLTRGHGNYVDISLLKVP